MRACWTVAANQLVRFVADWRGALMLLAIPLIFNLVLGLSLGKAFSPEFRPARPFRVAVAVPGSHPAAPVLAQVLEGAKGEGLVQVVEAPDGDAALRAVRRREVEAAMVLPADFPQAPLRVWVEPGTVPATVVESLAREAAAAASAPVASVPVQLAVRTVPAQGGAERAPVDAMAYYAAGMAVMMIYFATREGVQGYLRDRTTGVYLRVRAAGASRAAYLTGTFAGTVAVGLVFMAVMALSTRLFFGVHWGNPAGWFALTVGAVLASSGVNTLLLAFVRSPEVQEAVSAALAQVLAFLGGSMMPLYIFPDILHRISRWVPNRWMLEGYLQLMGGEGAAAVVGTAGRLALVGIVLLAVGWLVDSLAARTAGEV